MAAPQAQSLLPGLTRLRTSARIAVRAVEHRTQLALVEVGEIGARITRSVVGAVGAMVLLLLSGISVTALVAAIFWDTPHRITALAWLTGAEFLLGCGMILWVRASWRSWEPFQATREQFARDARCLHEILQDDHRDSDRN